MDAVGAVFRLVADDIDAARMPDTTKPQKNAGSIILESTMKMDSAADCVSSSAGRMERPIMPMATAQNIEMMTHTMAIRRDVLTSSSLRMPKKRTKQFVRHILIPKITN